MTMRMTGRTARRILIAELAVLIVSDALEEGRDRIVRHGHGIALQAFAWIFTHAVYVALPVALLSLLLLLVLRRSSEDLSSISLPSAGLAFVVAATAGSQFYTALISSSPFAARNDGLRYVVAATLCAAVAATFSKQEVLRGFRIWSALGAVAGVAIATVLCIAG